MVIHLDKNQLIESLVEALERRGFRVQEKIRLSGISGLMHDIDIYFEYDTPMGVFKGILYVVPDDKDVDKKFLEAVSFELHDLRASKAIVVVSKVTGDVLDIAERLNIDLWDSRKIELFAGVKLPEREVALETYYIKPRIPLNTAEDILKHYEGLGLFLKRKRLVKTDLVYLPLYELTAELTWRKIGEEDIEIRVINVYFETQKGCLASFDNDGTLSVGSRFGDIASLKYDAIIVLKLLVEKSEASFEELSEELEWDEKRLHRVLLTLLDRDLIDIEGERYVPKLPEILLSEVDIRKFYSLEKGRPKEGEILKPKIDILKPYHVLVALNCEVTSRRLIYYPLYIGVYKREGEEAYSFTVIDGNTGKTLDPVEVILGETGVLYDIEHKVRASTTKQ